MFVSIIQRNAKTNYYKGFYVREIIGGKNLIQQKKTRNTKQEATLDDVYLPFKKEKMKEDANMINSEESQDQKSQQEQQQLAEFMLSNIVEMGKFSYRLQEKREKF
ncbi:MAG: hypothetical protein RUMPE_00938 [Eubacteriales bacterium SKADARSKE-1]|nr:hypothetical protein [Eubacteriales bacterium SKADARSKE-1]